MVNVPLSEQWALRAAGYLLDNKGFLENLAGGDDLGFHQVSAGRVRCAAPATCSTRRSSRPTRTASRIRPSTGCRPTACDEEEVNIDLGDDGIDESDVFEVRAILEWSLAERLHA